MSGYGFTYWTTRPRSRWQRLLRSLRPAPGPGHGFHSTFHGGKR